MIGKSDFITKYAIRRNITKSQATDEVNAFLDTLVNAVNSDEGVRFPGVISFSKKLRKGRTYKKPATGEKYQTEDAYTVAVKIGSKFKQWLNEK